jgi:hypothetical protein
MAKKNLETIADANNDGNMLIAIEQPYVVDVTVTGDAPLLFHRYSAGDVEIKDKANKGDAVKKTDNIESYVYRDDQNFICMPGDYLRGAIVIAAKFKSDPRSPRKSAMDLFKAGIVPLTLLCPLNGGVEEWEYLDKRRVVIQRAAIPRQRPAFRTGWTFSCQLQVNVPEYISDSLLHEVCNIAGRLVGLADFRPTFGRFRITKFEKW